MRGYKAYARTICAALIAALVVPVGAGQYHVGAHLICSDCHTMHYSLAHDYGGLPDALPAGGPHEKLLKMQTNQLCLSCHDGKGWAPDVLGTNVSLYVRQAGALNAPGTTGYASHTGHTLGSTATAPGGDWSGSGYGLTCSDCHDPHGVPEQFRNLRVTDDPSDKFYNKHITYSLEVFDPSKSALIKSPAGSVGMERAYGAKAVWFGEPSSTRSDYSAWCGSCHSDFHGSTSQRGGGTGYLRHPTEAVNVGGVGGEHSSLERFRLMQNKVKVMSATGVWTGTDVADGTPSCFSCHKAHGNRNAFGLIHMSGTGTVSEEGDTDGIGNNHALCGQCHVQGS